MDNKKKPSFNQKLRAGKTLLGGWLQIASVTSAELIGSSGFDWAAVDCEHGLIDLPVAADMLCALESHGVYGLIRLPVCEGTWIRRALDAGASGLIVPMVNSPAIAREAVRWSKYPPIGERGFGFSRANAYGGNFDEYCALANDSITLVLQIEHISAVKQIDDILAVQGIDGIFIGPYDLAGSMGLVGQPQHPQVLAECDNIRQAAQAKNIPTGIHVVSSNAQDAVSYIENGFQIIALGIDTLFVRHTAEKLVAGAKKSVLRQNSRNKRAYMLNHRQLDKTKKELKGLISQCRYTINPSLTATPFSAPACPAVDGFSMWAGRQTRKEPMPWQIFFRNDYLARNAHQSLL